MPADLSDASHEPLEFFSRTRKWLWDPESFPMRPLTVCTLFVVFAILAYTLHRSGFDAPMIYDSRGWIENKSTVFAQHKLHEVISIVPARPLFMLTLYANYVLSGLDPAAFRLTNALILAATGLVLVLLSTALFGIARPAGRHEVTARQGISLFLGLVFVVHPLQSLTVLYIWQREAILACFFFYAGITVYVSSRSEGSACSARACVLAGLLYVAGLLSKENVASFPVILVLVEWLLFPQDRRLLFANVLRIAAFTVPLFAVYMTVTSFTKGTESVQTAGIVQRLAEYYEDAGIGPLDVLLTESRVLFSYLGLILLPSYTGQPLLKAEIVSTSLLHPPATLYAVGGITGLVGMSVALARKRPLFSFGMLFFLLTSGPEAILLPQYLFCGYRAILPMAGVLIALGDAALLMIALLRPRISTRVLMSALAVIAVVPLGYLSAVTVLQARRWHPLPFWRDAYIRLPPFADNVAYRPYSDILHNYGLELVNARAYPEAVSVLGQAVDIEFSSPPRPDHDERDNLRIRGTRGSKVAALINLGLAWHKSGNMAEAMACLQKAVATSPHSAVAHNALAGVCKDAGKRDEALRHYRKAVALDPGFAVGYNGLGLVVEESGDSFEAIKLYRKALELSPGFAEAHNNLGTALEKIGNMVEAMDQYRQAIESNPRLTHAHDNLGVLLRRLGKVEESINHHRQAILLDPLSAMSYANLGAALEASGNVSAALASYRKAVAFSPDVPDVNYALANALLKSGKPSEAVKFLRRTVALSPRFMEAHANLGLALLSMGSLPQAVESLQKALALDGNVAGLHNALGVALAQQGKRGEAIAHLRKALEIDPNDSRAGQNLRSVLREEEASENSNNVE